MTASNQEERQPLFPCPACGFRVFSNPPGSFSECPVCGWEDDEVQLRYPGTPTGANANGLMGYQKRVMERIPVDIPVIKGFERDSEWRPLRPEEATGLFETGEPGKTYFDELGGETPKYYWKKSAF